MESFFFSYFSFFHTTFCCPNCSFNITLFFFMFLHYYIAWSYFSSPLFLSIWDISSWGYVRDTSLNLCLLFEVIQTAYLTTASECNDSGPHGAATPFPVPGGFLASCPQQHRASFAFSTHSQYCGFNSKSFSTFLLSIGYNHSGNTHSVSCYLL